MISQALTLVERPENAIILLGKQDKLENTSGESKIVVHARIASDPEVLPQLHKKNPIAAGKKWQSKFNSLCKAYRDKYKELMGTGGGVGHESLSSPPVDEDGIETGAPTELKLDFYLGPDGPDKGASKAAWNVWEKATSEFKWFKRLHKILNSRPNQVPIALTTGIGPNGPQTVFHQPPSRCHSPDWDEIEGEADFPTGENAPSNTGPQPARNRNATPGPSVIRDKMPLGAAIQVIVVDKGKQVHPDEHRPKQKATGASMVEQESMPPASSNSTAGLDKKATVMKTGPSPSKNMSDFKQADKTIPSSTEGNQTSGKRKNRELDGIFALHQGFSEQQAKRDTQKAYESEIDLLIKTKSVTNMPNNEFYRREHQVKKHYGRLARGEATPPPAEPHPAKPCASPPPNHTAGRVFDSDVIIITSSPLDSTMPIDPSDTLIKQEPRGESVDLSLPSPQNVGRFSPLF
ncbi:hypothetical protein RSAG8_12886, partial [Rhizoctonia solani AG-8 WAC10335]